ncbi:DUF1703-domain-containing protein [Rickenella mellea]|uniref:DUF1703-domain-containing protein n=1 Tax=Rickenella mellea TaxID=50990 RepID=A0A4Y7Q6Y5_9AGAM|nr:DUF1703-domain-containing protein [Rickenella mellea]
MHLPPPTHATSHVTLCLSCLVMRLSLPFPANDLHRRKRSIEDVSHSPIDAPQSSKRAKLALERLHGSKTVYRTKSEQPSGSLSFPDGSDFHSLVTTSDLIAADKTQYIEKLDSSSTYHYMFLRPRRWGKSTFLRTLTDYYDKYTADTFNDKFGQLYIGKNPTPSHNTLLILFFDFSSIRTASYEVMQLDFDAYVLRTLRKFLVKYKDLLGGPDPETLPNRGSDALDDVFSLVMSHDERIFLGVDEYDAPANSCLFSSNSQHTANYETVSWLFKTQFYTIVKRHSSSPVSKSWLTGVLPVFREGISPLTATTIVSMMSRFHGLCGLSEDEVGTIAKGYLGESHPSLDQILQQLKRWFNGFIFVSEKEPSSVQDERHSPVVSLYNPQQVFTHLWKLSDSDSNPTMDAGGVHTDSVLKAIPNSSETGFSALDLMTVLTSTSDSRLDILREFGVSEVAAIGKDIKITWTILYYFGVLTFGENGRLRAPNETMRYLVCTFSYTSFIFCRTIYPDLHTASLPHAAG